MSGIFELLGYIGNLRLAKIAGSDKATEGDRPTSGCGSTNKLRDLHMPCG
jgi:hypothetical protein